MKILPARPHLDHLKKQAKLLLEGVRHGTPEALERMRLALPAAARLDHAAIAAMGLRLHDAQSCIAREYGFGSWSQLKEYVALQASASADVAARRRQWTHWVFGQGYQTAKPALAERLLREHPDLLAGEPALACAIGDIATVQAVLAADPAWARTARADNGMPPLACATFSGMIALPAYAPGIRACVDLLLAAGADPDARWTDPELPGDPLSVLYGAAGRNHDAALARRLLEAGADPNDNESLYHATETADGTIVRLLLEAGARVVGSNALFRALDYERPDMVRLLLAHGGDPNEPGPGGCPLLHAIRRRSPATIGLLLDAGADPSARNGHGITAYRLARCLGLAEVTEQLVHAGAVRDDHPDDAFLSACARGDRAGVQAMLADDPDLIGKLPPTALRLLPEMAAANDVEPVRVMVEAGWPITARGGDIDGSALNWAVFRGNAALARFLLDHGARYDERHGFKDNVYGTLSFASQAQTTPGGDWLACAKALIDAGSPLPEERYAFPEDIAAYFDQLRMATD